MPFNASIPITPTSLCMNSPKFRLNHWLSLFNEKAQQQMIVQIKAIKQNASQEQIKIEQEFFFLQINYKTDSMIVSFKKTLCVLSLYFLFKCSPPPLLLVVVFVNFISWAEPSVKGAYISFCKTRSAFLKRVNLPFNLSLFLCSSLFAQAFQ